MDLNGPFHSSITSVTYTAQEAVPLSHQLGGCSKLVRLSGEPVIEFDEGISVLPHKLLLRMDRIRLINCLRYDFIFTEIAIECVSAE